MCGSKKAVEGGGVKGRDSPFPREWAVRATDWVPLSWDSKQGRTQLTGELLGLTGWLCELWTLVMRNGYTLICLQGKVKESLFLQLLVLYDCLSVCLGLSWTNTLAPFIPYHSRTWIWGGHDQWENWTRGCRGNMVLGWNLGELAVDITGAYSRRASDFSWWLLHHSSSPPPPHSHHPIHAESPFGSHLPLLWLHNKVMGADTGGSNWLWGTKVNWTQNVSGRRKTIAGACIGNASETTRTSMCSWHEPRALMNLTCFSTPPLWGKGPGAEKGGEIHLKGTVPAQARWSGLLLLQLEIRPCP